jgi:putative ABC transport system permease protein
MPARARSFAKFALSAVEGLKRTILRWFGLHQGEMEGRMSQEMRFHVDMAVEQNIRAGMSPEEARRTALVAFGGRDRWAEAARDEYRSRYLEELAQDARYAARSLRHSPSFTFAAVATLALSIGATTSMFSVVNAVLLRGLPYPNPSRIVVLCEHNLGKPDAAPCNVLNPSNFLYWRDVSKSFAELGSFVETRVAITGAGAEPVSALARISNASVFSILGARTAAGRVFTEAEDRQGAPDVLVLSHAFWQQHFSGDPTVVGKRILMNTFEYTIIGVTGPGFGIYDPVDVWLPMRFTAQHRAAPGRYLRGVARLRPGVSVEQADGEMKVMAVQRAKDNPRLDAKWTAGVTPLRENLVGSSERALWVLLGAVGFLLVIACANVANLLLARAADREREVAVRISLGASPTRIVRQLLTESVVLSLISAVLGLAIAVKGTQALVALVPSAMAVQSMSEVSVDWRVLVFTAAVAVVTGVVFGLAPAYHATRGDTHESLKSGGRGGSSVSRASGRLRNALVIAEMSLALVLLAGAGLMVRSFAALQQVRLGFDPAHALSARLTLPGRKYPNDTVRLNTFREVERRIAALPGVKAVGMISWLPLTGLRAASWFNVEGRPPAEHGAEPVGDMRAVTPGYFQAMGIAIKQGRGLTEADAQKTPAVGVVSETLARTFWPNESAVGHYLLYEWNGNERVQIVGIASDVHHDGPDKAAYMEIYRPLAQFPYSGMALVVRGSGDAAALAGPVREVVRSIDRELPLAQVRTMDDLVSESLGRTRLSTTLFSLFGALGLLLAAVGIYGVTSYTVQQRRHEIGIRMALGARPGTVVRMVVRRGAALVGAGIVIGTVGGLAGGQLMQKLLFNVSPGDTSTFVAIAALLGAVGLVAAYVPARRATRVDPVAVLRGE